MSTSVTPPPPPSTSPQGQAPSPPTTDPAHTQTKRPVWKRWWFWIGAVVVLVVVVSMSGGGDSQTTEDAGGSGGGDTNSTSEAKAGIGDSVADGQFTFSVTDVKCGESSIGNGFLREEAQGQYCLVDMKVKNTGSEPATMDSSSQYMYIGDKEYTTSSDALLSLKDSENFFLQEINPGNAVEGTMVFDIPKGGTPDRIELHDSPFSGGVSVYI